MAHRLCKRSSQRMIVSRERVFAFEFCVGRVFSACPPYPRRSFFASATNKFWLKGFQATYHHIMCAGLPTFVRVHCAATKQKNLDGSARDLLTCVFGKKLHMRIAISNVNIKLKVKTFKAGNHPSHDAMLPKPTAQPPLYSFNMVNKVFTPYAWPCQHITSTVIYMKCKQELR